MRRMGIYPKNKLLPAIIEAAESCPILCITELKTDMPVYDSFSLLSFIEKYIVSTLNIPPKRDMKPALAPDSKEAKPAFITAIPKAGKSPNAEQVNITIILEKPGFIPIGRGKAERSNFSIKESASAKAPRIPVIAIKKIF